MGSIGGTEKPLRRLDIVDGVDVSRSLCEIFVPLMIAFCACLCGYQLSCYSEERRRTSIGFESSHQHMIVFDSSNLDLLQRTFSVVDS